MMVTLAAMALLSSLLVTIQRGFSTSGSVLLKAKAGIEAISIANSIVQEASGKHFDASTATAADTNLSQLNSPSSLGGNTGEITSGDMNTFNDFDDFNNFSFKLRTALPDSFTVKCNVVYVNPSDLSATSSVRTWHKKLTVTVSNPALGKDTIRTDYVYSYWYFR
jgi:hypothetical protein